MSKAIVGERYRHYKGKEYTVIALAHHTETMESLVVYRAEYYTAEHGEGSVWCRPLEMFESQIELDDVLQDRFKLI